MYENSKYFEIHSIFEWTIENFSCWNNEVHGNAIPFPKYGMFDESEEKISLQFFPKGPSGDEKHLVVKICNPFLSGDCELSFIGSDGSLIYKESRDIKEHIFETFTGPTYEKVITQIRKHEAVHTDLLTLRCRIQICFLITQKLRTVIDVFSTSLKINCEFCNEKGDSDRGFSQIQYLFEDGKIEHLDFSVIIESSSEEVNLNFKLRSVGRNTKKTLALICISYQQSDEAILKHEEAEHIFTGRGKWISEKPLPIKKIDITGKTCYVILDLKIVTGKNHKEYSNWSLHPDKTEITLEDTTKIPRVSRSDPPDTSVDVLTKEMMSLFQDQDFTDLQLRCGLQSFAVHRGILSARSPVFKNLLTTDMRDASSGCLDIVDLDATTLARFLAFLYSGTVEADLRWDITVKLYCAADKYQVFTLKKECASVLSRNVSISNVSEIVSLAFKHQDEQLRSVAHDFISENYDRVTKSQEWLDLMAVDPILILDTIWDMPQSNR